MVCKFFDKKTGSGISVNEQLARELHKPVFKKLSGQHILLTWNHCHHMLRTIQLNPSCVWQSTKENGVYFRKGKKEEQKKRKHEELLKTVVANKRFWKTPYSEQRARIETVKRLQHL